LLNSKNFVIERSPVAIGTLDSATVHAREIFRLAIELSARSVLMVHNHPSGDPAPSREDISLTKQMVDAGKIIGITLLDHVVIGRKSDSGKGYVSIRDDGLCEF
jgi:DNA repair protein RadC